MPIIETYGGYDDAYFQDVLDNGKTLYTSGTTGAPKELFKTPANVKAVCKANIKLQNITSNSRIYTCTDPNRSGGLFVQSLPALTVGADVYITEFNAYRFVRELVNYSHTAITPRMAKLIMATKNFRNVNLTGIVVNIGSEPVTFDIIREFVEKGAHVTIGWGASEVGPLGAVSWFRTIADVDRLEALAPKGTTPLGEELAFEYRLSPRGTMMVKGDISIFDDWWDTGDLVDYVGGSLFYRGRLGFKVDFDNPQK